MRAGMVPLARAAAAAAAASRKSAPKQAAAAAGKAHSTPSQPSPKQSVSSKPGASKPTTRTKPNAFQTPLSLSPTLRDFLGVSRSSRADTMKKVWAYIRENKLQSTDLKSMVICDEKLKVLFGQDSAKFLEIPKLLNAHYIKE
eukprot:c21425_g1_i2 orf=173-601(+)